MGITAIGARLDDLDTPVLAVDLNILEANIADAAARYRTLGVGWRPHTKGQKVPAIVHRELAAGAIGITCAKLSEAEVMAAAGIRSILIANQVVGRQKVARLANLARSADVIAAVDSIENMQEIAAAGQEFGTPVAVVIEVDIGMGRAGVLPEAVAALAEQAASTPGIRFRGVMGWEGHARATADPVARRPVIEQAVGLLVQAAEQCRAAGLAVEIVSCGGTGTEYAAAAMPGVTEIQAGGIIFNDVYYSRLGLARPFALSVISTVTSRPAPARIVTDAGLKAMSADHALPQPRSLGTVARVSLSAEHGVVELATPAEQPCVGDRLEWIVGYADTTVFLHDELYAVRDGRVEAIWPVTARGKLQ